MSFLANLISGVFNEIKKVWKELSPEIQAATLQASGIIAIVNANVNAVPTVIWDLIQTQYPNITQAAVTAALVKANNTVNAANALEESATFEQALQTIQSYLNGLSGNSWITVTKTVVALLADIFAPGETVIQKIELCLEWVYQELVKPNVPIA